LGRRRVRTDAARLGLTSAQLRTALERTEAESPDAPADELAVLRYCCAVVVHELERAELEAWAGDDAPAS
jgi:hypothetical protein